MLSSHRRKRFLSACRTPLRIAMCSGSVQCPGDPVNPPVRIISSLQTGSANRSFGSRLIETLYKHQLMKTLCTSCLRPLNLGL